MNNQNTYAIGSGLLTYDIIEHILKEDMKLTLSDDAKKKINHCREYLNRKEEDFSKPVYGVTTGFGSLCDFRKTSSRAIPAAWVLLWMPWSSSLCCCLKLTHCRWVSAECK